MRIEPGTWVRFYDNDGVLVIGEVRYVIANASEPDKHYACTDQGIISEHHILEARNEQVEDGSEGN